MQDNKPLTTPFGELCSMCEFAIEIGDIDILKFLIEDDPEAVKEWQDWYDARGGT